MAVAVALVVPEQVLVQRRARRNGDHVSEICPGIHCQLRKHPGGHERNAAENPAIGHKQQKVVKQAAYGKRRHLLNPNGEKQIAYGIGDDDNHDKHPIFLPEGKVHRVKRPPQSVLNLFVQVQHLYHHQAGSKRAQESASRNG